jgi:hypothetical protein
MASESRFGWPPPAKDIPIDSDDAEEARAGHRNSYCSLPVVFHGVLAAQRLMHFFGPIAVIRIAIRQRRDHAPIQSIQNVIHVPLGRRRRVGNQWPCVHTLSQLLQRLDIHRIWLLRKSKTFQQKSCKQKDCGFQF